MGNRQRFKQQVVDAIAEGNARVIADFSQCGYVDTSGLGVLVSCAKKCREAQGSFELRGLNEDLKTLMELSHLTSLFTIRDALGDALGVETVGG